MDHYMNTTQQPVAIVTGASRGIGLGVTQALLERGWRVVGTSRTISSSKDLTPSPDLVLVDGDVGNRETAIKVVEAALKISAALICWLTMPESFFRRSSQATPKKTTIW